MYSVLYRLGNLGLYIRKSLYISVFISTLLTKLKCYETLDNDFKSYVEHASHTNQAEKMQQ